MAIKYSNSIAVPSNKRSLHEAAGIISRCCCRVMHWFGLPVAWRIQMMCLVAWLFFIRRPFPFAVRLSTASRDTHTQFARDFFLLLLFIARITHTLQFCCHSELRYDISTFQMLDISIVYSIDVSLFSFKLRQLILLIIINVIRKSKHLSRHESKWRIKGKRTDSNFTFTWYR